MNSSSNNEFTLNENNWLNFIERSNNIVEKMTRLNLVSRFFLNNSNINFETLNEIFNFMKLEYQNQLNFLEENKNLKIEFENLLLNNENKINELKNQNKLLKKEIFNIRNLKNTQNLFNQTENIGNNEDYFITIEILEEEINKLKLEIEYLENIFNE